MFDWILSHGRLLWWLAIVSAAMFVASLAAMPWLLVRIPPGYFMTDKHPHPWADRHPLIRTTFLVAKNLLGIVLVLLGVLMLVLPGQGILTIIVGLLLMNFPGKHRLLLWTISRPAVLRSVNWVRAKAGHEPLVVPNVTAESSPS